jgi:hypothetical protein
MNIIQLQDRLKGMPEEALIGYVQTPTGEAPTYLVLSELERRKVMRDKYAGQQVEQPPVAEQIVSESMTEIMPQPPMAQGIATGMPPQGMPPAAPQEMMSKSIDEVGIAANPTPNIGQNYNAGGVVGYAKGGELSIAEVQKLRKDGYYIPVGSTIDPRLSEAARLVALDEQFGRRDSPGQLAELGRKFMGTDKSQLKQRILNRANREDFGMLPVGTTPFSGPSGPIGFTGHLAAGTEPSPISYDANGELEEYSSGISSIPLVDQYMLQSYPQRLLGSGIEAVTDFTGNTINKYIREPMDPFLRSLQKEPLTEEEITDNQDQFYLDQEQAPQDATIKKQQDARLEDELENIAKTGTNVAGNAGTNVASGNAVGDAGGNAPILTKAEQDAIILEQRQNYYDGIKAEQAALADVFGLQSSKDFYEGERKALQDERDKYAGDKDSALNMALINAGLGIAGGTSSNFLENVATGAIPGITSYTQDMKDMRAEDRLFDKEERAITRGERAEGRADLTEYRANELALKKLLQDSGLSTAESATIMKDARAGASVTIGEIYPNGVKDAPGDTLKQKETNYYKVLDNITKNRFKEMINAKVMPSVSIGDNTGFTATRVN